MGSEPSESTHHQKPNLEIYHTKKQKPASTPYPFCYIHVCSLSSLFHLFYSLYFLLHYLTPEITPLPPTPPPPTVRLFNNEIIWRYPCFLQLQQPLLLLRLCSL